jgi:hypothetical protein
MRSDPVLFLTVKKLGQCMNAGRSIQPSVPEMRAQLDGIDPQVQQSAPTQREIEQPMFRLDWPPESEVGLDE